MNYSYQLIVFPAIHLMRKLQYIYLTVPQTQRFPDRRAVPAVGLSLAQNSPSPAQHAINFSPQSSSKGLLRASSRFPSLSRGC